jgi:hypothetical protein
MSRLNPEEISTVEVMLLPKSVYEILPAFSILFFRFSQTSVQEMPIKLH